jgi:hypothetical protein
MMTLRLFVALIAATLLAAGIFTVSETAPAYAATKSMSQLLVGKAPLTILPAQRRAVLSANKGGVNFSCNGVFCGCRGDADCNDMFSTNVCGSRAVCIDNVCYCDRR